jgi:titin
MITTALVGDSQVTLTWTTPNGNGSSITGYIVEYTSTAGMQTRQVGAVNSAVITPLVNGTLYTFRVRAVTAAGEGIQSAASAAVAPFGLAGAPAGLSVLGANGSALLSWSAPTSNGAAITGYVVEYTSNAGTVTQAVGPALSTTISGLANGTVYTFRVAAVNAAGQGGFSAPSASVIPAPQAVAPSRLSGTILNGGVSLRWTAPRVPRGTRITDYVVQSSTDNGATWTTVADGVSTAARAVLTGLTNGVQHRFRVAAVTNGVVGVFSPISNAITPFDRNAKPAAPTNVSGSLVGSGRYSLQWNAVAGNAGGAVTDYVIQYRVNSARGSRWVTFKDPVSAATSATLTRLTNRTGYVFRVAAKNLAGIGAYSAEFTIQ